MSNLVALSYCQTKSNKKTKSKGTGTLLHFDAVLHMLTITDAVLATSSVSVVTYQIKDRITQRKRSSLLITLFISEIETSER